MEQQYLLYEQLQATDNIIQDLYRMYNMPYLPNVYHTTFQPTHLYNYDMIDTPINYESLIPAAHLYFSNMNVLHSNYLKPLPVTFKESTQPPPSPSYLQDDVMLQSSQKQITHKTCSDCHFNRGIIKFTEMPSSPDGFDSKCKYCAKLLIVENNIEITSKRCKICEKQLPLYKFYKNGGKAYKGACITCFKQRLRHRSTCSITDKICIVCEQELSITMFHKRIYNNDGYRTKCKACVRKHHTHQAPV